MTALQVLPDVVVLTRQYLLTVPEVTAVFTDRIATRSDGIPAFPYLTLQRIGGAAIIGDRLDNARVQLDSWGEDEATASLGIRTVRAALFALNRIGGWVGTPGVLTGVTDIQGPIWQPDTTRNPVTPRFISTLSIGARTP